MAFWGTEVKPGRPFTHAPLNGNGRLRLSGATLGIGSATQKSIVQCIVGNKSPVFVCCLFPEKAEFCQLDLEFEESDEVVFSVIGPRAVHLTGYYQSSPSLNHGNDESKSYGEDIGETDTERSGDSQETEYGGSFINDDDDDLQVFPSSPESSAPPGSNEEMLDLKKSKDAKGRRRRLRKKFQISESENDDSSQQKHFTTAVAAGQVIEDTLPISSLSRAKHASNSGKVNVEEKAKKETADLNGNEAENDATMLDGTNVAIGAQPESEAGFRNEEKAKKGKGNLNNNEAEDDATMLDGTNAAIGAQPECESGVRNEEKAKKEKGSLNNNEAEDDATMLDGTKAAIGAQPESESGVKNEGKAKEKGNLNNNEAEDDATMLDGTNAGTGVQPESESGVRNEEKAKKKKGNLNNNGSEDDATILDGTNAAVEAQPESELGVTNEEKQKHVLGVDSTLMSKNKREELEMAETFAGGAHGMIGEVVLEQNELASKEECKHDDLLLAVTQACLEDGAKLKRKRKKHLKDKTLKDNVSNENKTEELAKVERFPEGAHGMIGDVVLEQNELASKEKCKHDDLLLAASQVGLEDGAKLKRKRKKHVKEKTLEDKVSKKDECRTSGSNLDSVTQDVRLEDKGAQKQVNDNESGVRNEEKSKKEKGSLNNNEAEDDAIMLDGNNAAIGAQPEWNEEKAKKEKGSLNNNEAEDDATMLDRTNAAIGAQPECESGIRNEDGTNAAIGAQPECELGLRNEEKAKKEKGNHNSNEAEDDATMLDGTKAAIGAQPESESGVKNEEKAKEKGNLNNNEAEDDATMLDGINAGTGVQPGSESGIGNEEKAKNGSEDDNNGSEDDATMLDGTNAAVDAQPESELGVTNEEKQKHVLGVDSTLMSKNKREELEMAETFAEGAHGMIGEVVLEQNELANKEECKHDDLLLAASHVCLEDGAKLKRKRKKHVKEKTLEDEVSKKDECWTSGSNLDSVTQDVRLEDKGAQKQVNDKKRKKKKRRNSKEDGDASKMEPPFLSANQKEGFVVEMEGKNADDSATQLSNGIIIEELEMGKPDGKVASLGKKVRVHYIGKLKEGGQVFDSTAGKPSSKFHLGEEKVPELWNVGLDGMRVGGKRRLTVPPSVSYKNEGAGENIPPNSWLVFDVELVKVR